MGKTVVSILLGLVVGFALVAGIEMLGHMLYPIPENVDFNDKEAIKEMMKNAPIGALLMVVLAHLIGAAGAMFTTLKISKKYVPAYVVAGLFFLASTANLFMIPHPTWFTVTDILALITGFGVVCKLVKV